MIHTIYFNVLYLSKIILATSSLLHNVYYIIQQHRVECNVLREKMWLDISQLT